MSLLDLPNVVLVKIFKNVGIYETVRLFYKCRSKRIKPVLNDPSIWSYVHLSNSLLPSINYEIFDYFCQLLISNQLYVQTLIIDNDFEDICRQLLYNNGFNLFNFRSLKHLIINNEQILLKEQHCLFSKCSSTLETLKLNENYTNDKCDLKKFPYLTNLQLTIYNNIDHQSFQHLIELNIKIMFDYSSRDVFSRLNQCYQLRIFKLNFLLLNDIHFSYEFEQFLFKCSSIEFIYLNYLNGICQLIDIYLIIFRKTNLKRLILINMIDYNRMKMIMNNNQLYIPNEYFQIILPNNSRSLQTSSNYSCIRNELWFKRNIICIDYIQCYTTSMNLYNKIINNNSISTTISWSDKQPQTFELYILRTIYNTSYLHLIQSLTISNVQLSYNGLFVLITRLENLFKITMSHIKIDQMGYAFNDIKTQICEHKQINMISHLKELIMKHIQMSPRTMIQLCLILKYIRILSMDDVQLFKRKKGKDTRITILTIMKQTFMYTMSNKWNLLHTFILGKNMIQKQQDIDLLLTNGYSFRLNHLRITLELNFEYQQLFLKSMKKILKNYSKLTCLILDIRPDNNNNNNNNNNLKFSLEQLIEQVRKSNVKCYNNNNSSIYRYCFDIDQNDDEFLIEEEYFYKKKRTLCGIPIQNRKQKN